MKLNQYRLLKNFVVFVLAAIFLYWAIPATVGKFFPPERVRAKAESVLARLTGCPVQVESLRYNFKGDIRLSKVSFRRGRKNPGVVLENVRLYLDLLRLFRSEVVVRKLRIGSARSSWSLSQLRRLANGSLCHRISAPRKKLKAPKKGPSFGFRVRLKQVMMERWVWDSSTTRALLKKTPLRGSDTECRSQGSKMFCTGRLYFSNGRADLIANLTLTQTVSSLTQALNHAIWKKWNFDLQGNFSVSSPVGPVEVAAVGSMETTGFRKLTVSLTGSADSANGSLKFQTKGEAFPESGKWNLRHFTAKGSGASISGILSGRNRRLSTISLKGNLSKEFFREHKMDRVRSMNFEVLQEGSQPKARGTIRIQNFSGPIDWEYRNAVLVLPSVPFRYNGAKGSLTLKVFLRKNKVFRILVKASIAELDMAAESGSALGGKGAPNFSSRPAAADSQKARKLSLLSMVRAQIPQKFLTPELDLEAQATISHIIFRWGNLQEASLSLTETPRILLAEGNAKLWGGSVVARIKQEDSKTWLSFNGIRIPLRQLAIALNKKKDWEVEYGHVSVQAEFLGSWATSPVDFFLHAEKGSFSFSTRAAEVRVAKLKKRLPLFLSPLADDINPVMVRSFRAEGNIRRGEVLLKKMILEAGEWGASLQGHFFPEDSYKGQMNLIFRIKPSLLDSVAVYFRIPIRNYFQGGIYEFPARCDGQVTQADCYRLMPK